MLVLFTDTDTDITPEVCRKYGYRLISMPYSIDGKTYYPYESWESFDCHEYYEKLRAGLMPTTSSVNEEKYVEYFEPVFAAGDDILYVHFSRKMSGTFENMDRVVKQLKEKYPERRFYEIDTKSISIGALNMVEEIGDMVKAGKSVEEIQAWAEKEIPHFACYYFASDLHFFKRSGRVSGLAATMGTFLGVRPIIYMTDEGTMVNCGKEKGKANAIKRLVNYVKELGDNVKDHCVMIANGDIPDAVEQIKEALYAEFGSDLRIEVYDVNPVIGAHCGPSCTGISFHAIHR